MWHLILAVLGGTTPTRTSTTPSAKKRKSFYITRLDAMIQMAMKSGGNVSDKELEWIDALYYNPRAKTPTTQDIQAQVSKNEQPGFDFLTQVLQFRYDSSKAQKNGLLSAMIRVAFVHNGNSLGNAQATFLNQVAGVLGLSHAHVKKLLHAERNKASDISVAPTVDMEREEDEEEGKAYY